MATNNMKRITADLVASYLSTNIPGLTGKVFATAAGPETNLPCLAARVISTDPMVFESTQEYEVYQPDIDDGNILVDVGQFTGQFVIELYTTSTSEREFYEQAILDLFLATEWASGTLFLDSPNLTVNGYVSLYSAQVKVRLVDEMWNEEMAFESKRYTFLDISVDYPALTTRQAADMTDLELHLANVDSMVILDAVEILDDGTTVLVPVP